MTTGVQKDRPRNAEAKVSPDDLLRLLKVRFETAELIRRGICLLNAGYYEKAQAAFNQAVESGSTERSLPSYMAACFLGQGKPALACEQFAKSAALPGKQTAARVRHALALWSSGKPEDAIESLRQSMRMDPECAEYHFQLGTLLASLERHEEAELRFIQAVNVDRNHTGALVSLAMCCGVRSAPAEAQLHLQRAQTLKPWDARIGLLLAQSSKAAQQLGLAIRPRAEMPTDDEATDPEAIEELSRIIEANPDFVDAFLSIPQERVDKRIFRLLLSTLRQAVLRTPEHAELHHLCGCVLARLGQSGDAIDENERALEIKPTHIRALIALGNLYLQTDRNEDAATRLERAIASGAEYADVYYLLGNLYRDRGLIGRARSAYRHALVLNDRYEAAIQALGALPVA